MKTSMFLALALLICTLAIAVLPLSGEEGVYEDVIRLHILANSDSPEDQADKLAVRDEILRIYGSALTNCVSREEAEAHLEPLTEDICTLAQEVLASRGRCAPVRVTLTEEWYPTRDYDTFSLPSGTYLSLRVLIGNAQGQNWWCVMYPPMCLGVATDGEVPLGMTNSEYGLMTENGGGKYTIKFRVLELLESYFTTKKQA